MNANSQLKSSVLCNPGSHSREQSSLQWTCLPTSVVIGIENPLHHTQRSISQVILDSVKFTMNMTHNGYGLMTLKNKNSINKNIYIIYVCIL